jgi:hypothetical protein
VGREVGYQCRCLAGKDAVRALQRRRPSAPVITSRRRTSRASDLNVESKPDMKRSPAEDRHSRRSRRPGAGGAKTALTIFWHQVAFLAQYHSMEEHPDVHLTHGRALCISNDDPVPTIAPATHANGKFGRAGSFCKGCVGVAADIVSTEALSLLEPATPTTSRCDCAFATHGAWRRWRNAR